MSLGHCDSTESSLDFSCPGRFAYAGLLRCSCSERLLFTSCISADNSSTSTGRYSQKHGISSSHWSMRMKRIFQARNIKSSTCQDYSNTFLNSSMSRRWVHQVKRREHSEILSHLLFQHKVCPMAYSALQLHFTGFLKLRMYDFTKTHLLRIRAHGLIAACEEFDQ